MTSQSTVIKQFALTVIAPIGDDAADALEALNRDARAAISKTLAGVTTLHFAKWVILRGDAKNPRVRRLAFESNHDGDRDDHLRELLRVIGPELETKLFGGWKGYEPGKLVEFCEKNALRAQAFYLGHPGLSAKQIQNDERLRRLLVKAANELGDSKESAVAIRKRMLKDIPPELLVHVDRGLPPDSVHAIFWISAVGVGLLGLALLPIALAVEQWERWTELALDKPDIDLLEEIALLEDAGTVNGLTHLVPLRTGIFRRLTTRAVLGFVEIARRFLCYKGDLTGIKSIHFARWVIVGDEVVFFSNYDGSWESYLGDFVDKAHYWLTAAWMGSKQFPKTRFYVVGGASREYEFKEWTRRWQVKNQIWYSAYPDLSVGNVLNNELIRKGALETDVDEGRARAWLALV